MKKTKNPETLEVLNSFGYRVVLPVVVQEGEYALLEMKTVSPTLGDMEVTTEQTQYLLAWQYVQVSFITVVTRKKGDRILGVHVRVSRDTPREFAAVAERLARSMHNN